MNFKKRFLVLSILSLSLLAPALKSSANSMWKKDNIGWWYQNQDGSYPKSQWKTINNKWYYFDTSGYLLTNTKTPDGYYVNHNGEWVKEQKSGWKKDNIGWWYETDGRYLKNEWRRIDNEWYYFDTSGYMATDKWIGNHYLRKDGRYDPFAKKNETNTEKEITFEVDDEYTYFEKLGNSGKFFVNQDDATEYATKALFADGEWGSQGYYAYKYIRVKHKGVVGWSIHFWKQSELQEIFK